MSSSIVEGNGWVSRIHKGSSKVGVVVIHEIYGRDDYVESVAADLALQGFWAATVDLYRGKYASSLEEGLGLRSSLSRGDIAAAVGASASLLSERIGGGAKVGSLGFCMGGGFALLGACMLPLAFCVDYYGMIEDADDLKHLSGPVLVILGSEDQRVTPWAYQSMLPAATKFGKRIDLQLYPNAKHAFHRPNWEGHNPEAAKDSWTKTVRFISEFDRSPNP